MHSVGQCPEHLNDPGKMFLSDRTDSCSEIEVLVLFPCSTDDLDGSKVDLDDSKVHLNGF